MIQFKNKPKCAPGQGGGSKLTARPESQLTFKVKQEMRK